MKLELKHVAPYLPYGLKIVPDNYRSIAGGYGYYHKELDLDALSNCNIEDLKPILRPMSDLLTNITHNKKEIIPVEWLESFYHTLDLHEQAIRLIEDSRWVNQCDYMLICHLIEWHFDVFDLIHAGLAIDINTLKS